MFLIIVELNYRPMNACLPARQGLRRNPAIRQDYEIPRLVQ